MNPLLIQGWGGGYRRASNPKGGFQIPISPHKPSQSPGQSCVEETLVLINLVASMLTAYGPVWFWRVWFMQLAMLHAQIKDLVWIQGRGTLHHFFFFGSTGLGSNSLPSCRLGLRVLYEFGGTPCHYFFAEGFPFEKQYQIQKTFFHVQTYRKIKYRNSLFPASNLF